MVTYLCWWKEYDNDGQRSYTARRPSWARIQTAFNRLDGLMYSGFVLDFHPEPRGYPQLLVRGGPAGYALTLSLGDASGLRAAREIALYNPVVAASSDANALRTIGCGYTNWELEVQELVSDRAQVLGWIEAIAHTSAWPDDAPARVRDLANSSHPK